MSLIADRHAMQRPDRLPVAAALVERARLRQRFIRIEMREGVHLAVDGCDPFETGADIFLGARCRRRQSARRPRLRSACRLAFVRHQFAYMLARHQSAMPGKT